MMKWCLKLSEILKQRNVKIKTNKTIQLGGNLLREYFTNSVFHIAFKIIEKNKVMTTKLLKNLLLALMAVTKI